MNRIERPARAREAVAAMDVVAGLTDVELDALLDELEWVEVPGGEALFHEGEESDSFYVIVRGRLRALLTDDAGEMVVIRELSRGDPVESSACSRERRDRRPSSPSATPSSRASRRTCSSARSSAPHASRCPSPGSSRTG